MRAGTDTSGLAAGSATERRIESLLDRCERAERPAHRISILQEVARLYEHELEDPGTAYVVLIAALEEDYGYEPVAAEVQRLAEELDLWAELLRDRLAVVAELERDEPAKAADLWVRIASWYRDALGEREYATAALRSALELEPDHPAGLAELAELLRADEAWLELGEVLDRRASAETDPEQRAALWIEIGEIAHARLDDAEWAIAAYRTLLRDEPDDRRALDGLERVYRAEAMWEPLLDVLATKADATDSDDERTALLLECARMLECRLGATERADLQYQAIELGRAVDVIEEQLEREQDSCARADLEWQLGRIQVLLDHEAAAERCFAQALVSRPGHLPALLALAALYERRRDWLKAAKTIARAEEHTGPRADRLALRLREARIYDRELGDTEVAIAGYESVLAIDPRHLEAARGLVDLRFRTERWESLEPLLDMLLEGEHGERIEPAERAELCFRTGRCAEALGKVKKALRCYADAVAADPAHIPALRARADLTFATGGWAPAIELYEQLLAEHGATLADADRGRIYERLGVAYQRRGEPEQALHRFESALLFDAHSRTALAAIVELQSAAGRWDAVAGAHRGLLHSDGADEQFQRHCAIAALLRDRLGDPHGAIASYCEAAELRPDDHGVRQKLLDLFTLTRQWSRAVATIEEFAEREPDPVRRGKYFQAAATICRDEIGNDDDAVAFFNLALDELFRDPERADSRDLPGFLKAFAAVDAILTRRRDWKLQERSYRQMIKRLPPGHPVLGELWHGLGEIYRTRLKKIESAIAAFEVAARLAPDNLERRTILAELYVVAGADRADKAVEAHRAILAADPTCYDSYHALARIYEQTQRRDEAWCVCAALAFLQRATPAQRERYQRYRRNHPIAAKRRFTDDLWKLVIPAGANRWVSALLGAVSRPAALLRARPHGAAGVDPAGRWEIERGGPPIARAIDYARKVLALPAPDVYPVPDRAGELALLNCRGSERALPSLLVFAHAMHNKDDKEVAFAAGRYVSYLRPDHYLRVALSSDAELRAALAAALRLGGAEAAVEPAGTALAGELLAAARAQLQPFQLDQHHAIVRRFQRDGARASVAEWRDAVDATCHRVGLLLCGDIEVATRMIARDRGPRGVGDSARDIRELLLYSISDDYFAARRQLGTDVSADEERRPSVIWTQKSA